MGADYTIELEEGLTLYAQTMVRALERVEDLGLDPAPPRPKKANNTYFDGRLPANVSSLPTKELADVYSHMCQYSDFVTSRLTQAKAETINAAEALSLTKAKVRKSKLGTVTEKDDDATCDSRFVQANAVWLEAKEYYEILLGIDSAAQRDLRTISRLFETRKIEQNQGSRDTNVNRPAFRKA